MILLIDNYDSFTYNLYQYMGELCPDIQVVRNDAITLAEIADLKPEAIVISPGPGYPDSAGISLDVIKTFAAKIPILGICLGHQAIAQAFGGKVTLAMQPIHGKSGEILLDDTCPLFQGLPKSIIAARYHSLITTDLPDCLIPTAHSPQGEIMGLRHRDYAVFGLQFHPESVLTRYGKRMLHRFISQVASITAKEPEQEAIPQNQRNALRPYLQKVVSGSDLSQTEAAAAMTCIMEGGATDAQIGAFLTALRMKGESVEEITGFAKTMRQKAKQVHHIFPVTDIVGTGGDLLGTFNISTTAAFVVSGAGLPVAKHGNRSVSSRCGSADVLEALGVTIAQSPEQAQKSLEEIGLCFLFAPSYHASMKHAAAPRRELGVRSVFNILGPLCNPAQAESMLLGVYDEALVETMARVLQNLGVERALVVHGKDGLDEISICDQTTVCEVRGQKLIKYTISPIEFALPMAAMQAILGGNAHENAEITRNILQGKPSAMTDAVLINSSAALYVGGKAESLEQGLSLARQSIASGAALSQLQKLIQSSKEG